MPAPDPTRIPPPASDRVGNLYGTAFVGAIDRYEQRFGTIATSTAVAKLQPKWGQLVKPNSPSMGILGARKYPYAFVGDLMRALQSAIRSPDEDAFLREIANAGVDATLDTVARITLRWLVSPATVAAKSPELWHVFHDCGRLTITSLTDHEFLSEVSGWPHHDVVVCKLGVEGGRRIVERTGVKNVTARREKCQAWGHDVCLTRIRWE